MRRLRTLWFAPVQAPSQSLFLHPSPASGSALGTVPPGRERVDRELRGGLDGAFPGRRREQGGAVEMVARRAHEGDIGKIASAEFQADIELNRFALNEEFPHRLRQ